MLSSRSYENMNPVKEIRSADEFSNTLKSAKKDLVVVHFWAPWAEQCAQMNDAMDELTKEYVKVHFCKLEAEEMPEIAVKYNIVAVPTFIFFKNGHDIDRLNGADVPELEKLVKRNLEVIAPDSVDKTDSKEDLHKKLERLINSFKCILFMKGTPETPRCGFSRQTIGLLKKHNCDFGTFDILEDQDVRQGLKEYSNWPTYPQLYIDGKLIGGLDILKEMDEDGELADQLPKISAKPSLEERLKKLINSDKVVLFMKGSPSTPRCGFSRQMIEILNEIGTKFDHFDILTDDEVRQGLKKFSNWPTYPQLYANGNLIGGLDIIKDMREEGELEEVLRSD